MSDVFERIRASITGQHTSAEIGVTIALTKAALAEEAGWRGEYQTTAEDPLVASDVADEAAEKLAKSHTTTKRLTAALDRLEPIHAAALHAEHQARLVPVYEKAKAERAKLLAGFEQVYAKAVDALVAHLQKMRDWDGDRVETPIGSAPLLSLKSELGHLKSLTLPTRDGFAWGRGPDKPLMLQTAEDRMRAPPEQWP